MEEEVVVLEAEVGEEVLIVVGVEEEDLTEEEEEDSTEEEGALTEEEGVDLTEEEEVVAEIKAGLRGTLTEETTRFKIKKGPSLKINHPITIIHSLIVHVNYVQ